MDYVTQKKISFRLFELEQKVFMKNLYPFLSKNQINRKVKERWSKLQDQEKKQYMKTVVCKTPTKASPKVSSKKASSKVIVDKNGPSSKETLSIKAPTTKQLKRRNSGDVTEILINRNVSYGDGYDNDFMCMIPSPRDSGGNTEEIRPDSQPKQMVEDVKTESPSLSPVNRIKGNMMTESPSLSTVNRIKGDMMTESPSLSPVNRIMGDMMSKKNYLKGKLQYTIRTDTAPDVVDETPYKQTGILKAVKPSEQKLKGRVSFSRQLETERHSKDGKSEQTERHSKDGKSEQTERHSKDKKSEQTERHSKDGKSEQTERHSKDGKSEQTERHSKDGKSEQTERLSQEIGSDQSDMALHYNDSDDDDCGALIRRSDNSSVYDFDDIDKHSMCMEMDDEKIENLVANQQVRPKKIMYCDENVEELFDMYVSDYMNPFDRKLVGNCSSLKKDFLVEESNSTTKRNVQRKTEKVRDRDSFQSESDSSRCGRKHFSKKNENKRKQTASPGTESSFELRSSSSTTEDFINEFVYSVLPAKDLNDAANFSIENTKIKQDDETSRSTRSMTVKAERVGDKYCNINSDVASSENESQVDESDIKFECDQQRTENAAKRLSLKKRKGGQKRTLVRRKNEKEKLSLDSDIIKQDQTQPRKLRSTGKSDPLFISPSFDVSKKKSKQRKLNDVTPIQKNIDNQNFYVTLDQVTDETENMHTTPIMDNFTYQKTMKAVAPRKHKPDLKITSSIANPTKNIDKIEHKKDNSKKVRTSLLEDYANMNPAGDANVKLKDKENYNIIQSSLRKQGNTDFEIYIDRAEDDSCDSDGSYKIQDAEYNSEVLMCNEGSLSDGIDGDDELDENTDVSVKNTSKILLQAIQRLKQAAKVVSPVLSSGSSPRLLSPALSGISQFSNDSSLSSLSKSDCAALSETSDSIIQDPRQQDMTPPEKKKSSIQGNRRMIASAKQETNSNFKNMFREPLIFD